MSRLKSRFASDFKTKGCYIISQRYLYRKILRQWPGDKIERINPPLHLPSRSWMEYKGGIGFMGIPFEDLKWSNAVIWFPGILSKLELRAPVIEFLHCTIEPQNLVFAVFRYLALVFLELSAKSSKVTFSSPLPQVCESIA